ncbi:acyltransferase [Pontibacter korlensis]|nr:DapH/DapD/GlmU-related protein [Pontibacter korlensis]
MNKSERKTSVIILFRLRDWIHRIRLFTRIVYYQSLGAKIGKEVKLGHVFMPVPEQVIIGDGCEIEDHVRLRAGGNWKSASIVIDKDSFIGHSTQINVRGPFKIGSKCLIAPMCVFSDAHHTFIDINIPIKNQKCLSSSIEVEDDVWIGTGCTVLRGVTIHTGAVIAAGAVVTESVPPYEIWGGIPARKLKSRK